jgi:signal transduction histidine kinase
VTVQLDPWLDEVIKGQKVPKEVTVECRFGAPRAVMSVDTDRLRSAIVKVFENALEVLVETPALPEQRVMVSTAMRDQFEIAITDTGPGIPPDILPRVFEPLFSTRSFGTGLGLATAKQIVENHSGDIAIAQGPEGGTRVVIRLPLGATKNAADA